MNSEGALNIKTASNFRELKVWQKAHALVLEIYKLTKTFPKEELYGLTSQLRRSGFSVPANIAEGFKKRGQKDKARFYNIAQGSLEETRYYLILAEDLGYGACASMKDSLDEVSRMLDSYINKLS